MTMKAGRIPNVRKDDGVGYFYGNGGFDSMRNSVSSTMISVVQMRRKGLMGNRELYEELKTKADKFEKEFKELQHQISSDRMDSGRWSKAPIEQDKEKGWDGGGGNSSRGKLYDMYMEKRVARLRTEQGSKRAAMNEAKLRALRDDLERCWIKLQGKVVSLAEEGKKDAELGGRQRLQKFWTLDSEASNGDDKLPISRSFEPQKDSPVQNPSSSSIARAIAMPIPRPSNKSTGSTSLRQRAKPENPLGFRKENTRPPPVIGGRTNRSTATNGVRTRKVREDPQRLRSSFKKSSSNPLSHNIASEIKTVKVRVNERKKESQGFDMYSTSFESKPLIRKAKQGTLVYEPRSATSSRNLSLDADDLAELAKVDVLAMTFDEEKSDRDLLVKFSKRVAFDEEDLSIGNSMVAAEGRKDSVKDSTHDDCYDDSPVSQSQFETLMNSASELPNTTHPKNFKAVSTENLNGIPKKQEMAPAIGDVKSTKAATNRIRRKIRNTPESVPPAASCSYGRSRMGISKGFKRFLIFRKRGRGDEISADCTSTTTSEGDEEIFTKHLVLEEHVRSLHFLVPNPSERIKRKGGYSSRRSLKETRSFLSLSSLRCRGDDTTSRQPIPRERVPT